MNLRENQNSNKNMIKYENDQIKYLLNFYYSFNALFANSFY